MELQKNPRFKNSHSQFLDLTTKKHSFSSVLSTSFKLLIIYSDISLNYKLFSLNDKRVDVWRSTASSPVQLHAPPAMLNSLSAIKNGRTTVLWRTVNTISGISPRALALFPQEVRRLPQQPGSLGRQ